MRLPFLRLGQYLGRKSILTRAPKRVKEAAHNLYAIHRNKGHVDISHPIADGRLAASRSTQVHSFWRLPMPGPIVCSQCDKTEQDCSCEKYCTICKGQDKVRLCSDGLYYCPDCREACDVALANYRGD
jgi:hypothetical protein